MKQCKIDGCDSTELATRSAMCRTHHREYTRQHYQDNKQYYLDKASNWRDTQRATARKIKDETPCTDCKVNYPYYVMDFDHRENKQFTIAKSYGVMSNEKFLAEIAKCDIVCANCHRMRTAARAGYGIDMETVVR